MSRYVLKTNGRSIGNQIMRSGQYADETVNIDKKDFYSSTDEELLLDDEFETDEEEDEEPRRLFRRKKKDEIDNPDDGLNLSKMKKKELLEIMLAQGREIDALRERVAELESQLANREFEFSKIGSIAEASLAVTNIFKEAEEAARIYLENIRRSYERQSNEHSR